MGKPVFARNSTPVRYVGMWHAATLIHIATEKVVTHTPLTCPKANQTIEWKQHPFDFSTHSLLLAAKVLSCVRYE